MRELRNLIERIVILNPQSRIDARHIPLQLARKTGRGPAAGTLRQSAGRARGGGARLHLRKLEEASGNVSRAAELLGLERSNLYRKMRALGIAPARVDELEA